MVNGELIITLANYHIITLTNAPFKAYRQQFLRFYRKFHRQLVHYLFGKTINDKRNRCFGIVSALVSIEDLVFTYFRGSGFVLYYC
jgi:hypothetical protein